MNESGTMPGTTRASSKSISRTDSGAGSSAKFAVMVNPFREIARPVTVTFGDGSITERPSLAGSKLSRGALGGNGRTAR
ncbi:hypothetical protein GCM10022224_032490 [Nonomuraea antimicrobica]|uniref:Uncharacterized protein n=1 Tax=Nonomuraea antimicrobica TaxID=561173 RepID=A0ABP7BR64_9ACTN